MQKPIHRGDFNQVAKFVVDLSTGQNNPEKLEVPKKKVLPKAKSKNKQKRSK